MVESGVVISSHAGQWFWRLSKTLVDIMYIISIIRCAQDGRVDAALLSRRRCMSDRVVVASAHGCAASTLTRVALMSSRSLFVYIRGCRRIAERVICHRVDECSCSQRRVGAVCLSSMRQRPGASSQCVPPCRAANTPCVAVDCARTDACATGPGVTDSRRRRVTTLRGGIVYA